MAKNEWVVLKQKLVKSPAWLSMGRTAVSVYLIFCTKRQIQKIRTKMGRSDEYHILNNGEIEFTYAEANEKYGISKNRYKRAIDELIEKGFIDIAATGMGVHKVTTLYAMSERWCDYGTPQFKAASRPKSSIANPGFRKGNTHWKKALKKKSSAKYVHCTMLNNEHGRYLAMHTNKHGEKVTVLYKWSKNQWLETKIA